MTSPKWQALTVRGGGFNPNVEKAAKEASGAYAIRRASDHEVLYVGESSRGALWRTLLRHFQAPESFRKVREGFVVASPVGYEVALHVTSRGPRPRESSKRAAGLRKKGGVRTDADQRASAAQARWIATLQPTHNKDDGMADVEAQELRELRARQEEEDREGGAFGSLLNPGAKRRGYYVLAWDGDFRTRDDMHRATEHPSGGKVRFHSTRKPDAFAFAHAWMKSTKSKGRRDLSNPNAAIVSIEHVSGGHSTWPARWDGDGRGGWEEFRPAVPVKSAAERYHDAYVKEVREHLDASRARSPREVLKAIEAGPSHSLAVSKIPEVERPEVVALVARGFVRKLPKRGRWPERYVVTSSGSHELGSFDSDDPSFREDAREAGALERERRAAVRAKPAGYGAIEAKGKHAGQARMFNPRTLHQLGLLTRLELADGSVLSWSLADAPVLAYDPQRTKAGGCCLVVCYRGRVVRPSTDAERREYRAKHWDAVPEGRVRDCGFAVGPYKSLGPSSSITYTTRKGVDVTLVDYVHPWGEGSSRRCVPPKVEEHACGRACGSRCAVRGAIRLTGGTYSLEDRGIVG